MESVPDRLFAGCTKTTTFASTFQSCTSLTEIPNDIFEECESVTTFSQAFQYCSSLESIPQGLFDDCENLTRIDWCFYNSRKIKTIPVDLFDNQRKLLDIDFLFNSLSQWEGESPYTMIDGVKVHLYERQNYPDHFVTPTSTGSCFSGCSSLSDYASIPSGWK